MGQQNILSSSPMLDVEHHHHHEPFMISYGGVTCFPQPYISHAIIQPSGNITTFDRRYLPENHGQLPYVINQYNGEHCNTFMIASPSASVFSVPVNHDHLPFLNNHQIFERNTSVFMDGCNRVFKRATGAMGFDFDPAVVQNSSHLVHGGQLVQPVPTPWFDQSSGSGGFSWNCAHGVPYLQEIALHGYQVAAISRNSLAFMHPHPMPPHQGLHDVYHLPPPPMPPVQPQNMDNHLQLPSTSHTRSSSTTYPFQNDADPWPRFVSHSMPHGVMAYEARRQPFMIDLIARHYSFPHLSVLPVDVEEQGEQFGNKDSCLLDDIITDHVKTRIFTTSGHLPAVEEPKICVICQMDFEDQEEIRLLNCRHEYHAECIKKWLNVKNNCPICKSTL